MLTDKRSGFFIELLDEEGCRHLLRVTSITAISDTDPLQNETIIAAAGRTVRVAQGLNEIAEMVFDNPRYRDDGRTG